MLVHLYRMWRRRQGDRRALQQMCGRDLRDLGITAAEVHRELARPFLRDVLRDVRAWSPNAHTATLTGRHPMSVLTATTTRAFSRRWWILALVVAAQFMFVVDAFIVAVAIPSIRHGLGATAGEIQGTVVLYQVAFAALIVTGGRLGDIRGSKRLFLLGLFGFTLASLWCGLARSGGELVLARALQGSAAALMIPQVLATIHRLFPGNERGRAFGVYGFTLGSGAAVGLGVGGWLVALDVAGLGWRMIFLVNLPVGAALLAAAARSMPNFRGNPRSRLDWIGAAMLLTALLCLLGPLLLGNDLGWPPYLVAVFAAGMVLLALMVPVERRIERRALPLVPLDLLRDGMFCTGLAAVFCFTFANFSFYITIMLYMQLGLGFSPLEAGMAIMPLAIGFAAMSRFAGPRAQRIGTVALVQGCGVQIAGIVLLGLAIAADAAASPAALALALLPFGLGQALVMAPLYGLVLSKVPAVHAGAGGGVMSTVQQIGNATGVAVIGAVYYAVAARHGAGDAMLASLAVLATALAATAGLLVSMNAKPTAVRGELARLR